MLMKKDLVDGLEVTSTVISGKCVDCLMGKATRRPFDAVVERESRILERVHTDLTGPMRVPARGGFWYMMPVVDGKSAFTKDYYLKDKEAETTVYVIEEYMVMAENVTGEKLLSVRIDGGGEFDNHLWRDWAKKNGIKLERIPAYSSAANGVAERKHRTTFDKVRTLLHDSGLPPSMWLYAAAYTTYTENLLPSTRANHQIPAELWTKK